VHRLGIRTHDTFVAPAVRGSTHPSCWPASPMRPLGLVCVSRPYYKRGRYATSALGSPSQRSARLRARGVCRGITDQLFAAFVRAWKVSASPPLPLHFWSRPPRTQLTDQYHATAISSGEEATASLGFTSARFSVWSMRDGVAVRPTLLRLARMSHCLSGFGSEGSLERACVTPSPISTARTLFTLPRARKLCVFADPRALLAARNPAVTHGFRSGRLGAGCAWILSFLTPLPTSSIRRS